jgi:hypothetical protein
MTAATLAPFSADEAVARLAPTARRLWERSRFVIVNGLYWGGVAAVLAVAWRIAFGAVGCIIV